jgi:hypothetical protein
MRTGAILLLAGAAIAGGWFVPDLLNAAPAAEVLVATPEQRADVERIIFEDMGVADVSWEDGCLPLMQQIPRGSAPQDFWDAWQEHVKIAERIAGQVGGAPEDEVYAAQDAYRASYLKLIAIAKRHGADTRAAERKFEV